MVERELEFRGISKEHLGMYFMELGAKQVTDSFPFVYEGDWMEWTDFIGSGNILYRNI